MTSAFVVSIAVLLSGCGQRAANVQEMNDGRVVYNGDTFIAASPSTDACDKCLGEWTWQNDWGSIQINITKKRRELSRTEV